MTELERVALTEEREPNERYLALSAILGLTRAGADFERADRILETVILGSGDRRLIAVAELWWADNALYSGRFSEAERRYLRGLQRISSLRDQSDREILLMGEALSDWYSLQLAAALKMQGKRREAAELLERRAPGAAGLRRAMQYRAGILARDIGDQALEARVNTIVPTRGHRRQGYGPARRAVPRELGTLKMRAPWEPHVFQRAGALRSSVVSYLLYAALGLRFGRPESPCGRSAGGFYYGTGTHSRKKRQGRDHYAIDFTAGGAQGTRWGRGSYGIQIRAAASGIVGEIHYSTETHRGVRSKGPTAANNSVEIFHFPEDILWLDLITGAAAEQVSTSRAGERAPAGGEGRRARRPLRRQRLSVSLDISWDYRSSYLHLVGLDKAGESSAFFPALVSVGQYVWRGSPLGYEDSTGNSLIDHLHFQVNANCRLPGVECGEGYRYLRDGKSVPIVVEGHRLGEADLGVCIESTNVFELNLEENSSRLPKSLGDLFHPDRGKLP